MWFDARLYPEGLADADLETLGFFSVTHALAAAVPPAPPTATAWLAALDALLTVQLPRLERAGLTAWAMLGVPASALPRRGLPEVLAGLPRLLRHPRAAVLGPLDLWKGGADEEEAFAAQLKLARTLRLPVVVASRGDPTHTRRALQLLKAAKLPPEQVLVDGANARTVKTILACGHLAGLSVHPDSLSAEAAVALVKSLGPRGLTLSTGAGKAAADLLAVARTVHLLGQAGLTRAAVAEVGVRTAGRLIGESFAAPSR